MSSAYGGYYVPIASIGTITLSSGNKLPALHFACGHVQTLAGPQKRLLLADNLLNSLRKCDACTRIRKHKDASVAHAAAQCVTTIEDVHNTRAYFERRDQEVQRKKLKGRVKSAVLRQAVHVKRKEKMMHEITALSVPLNDVHNAACITGSSVYITLLNGRVVEIITVQQAADILHLSPTKIRRSVACCKLKGVVVGRSIVIIKEGIQEFRDAYMPAAGKVNIRRSKPTDAKDKQ